MAASFDLIEAIVATTCDRYGHIKAFFYHLGFVDNRKNLIMTKKCARVLSKQVRAGKTETRNRYTKGYRVKELYEEAKPHAQI